MPASRPTRTKAPPLTEDPLRYERHEKLGEGSFADVVKCQRVTDGQVFAMKVLKQRYRSKEQIFNLRELRGISRLSACPHIVRLEDIVYEPATGTVSFVFELMQMNIFDLINGRRKYLPEAKVKRLMFQLCQVCTGPWPVCSSFPRSAAYYYHFT